MGGVKKKEGAHECYILNGSIIKVRQDARRSGYYKISEAMGLYVSKLSTKIHAKVDFRGQLFNILLTPVVLLEEIPQMLFRIGAMPT